MTEMGGEGKTSMSPYTRSSSLREVRDPCVITENLLVVCCEINANAIWGFLFGNEPIDGRVDPRLRGDDGEGY